MRIGLVLMLSMIVSGVFAQQRGQGGRNMDPEAQAEQQVNTMKEIVKLDKKEVAAIKEVFLNTSKEMGKMRESMQGADREAMREKMTAVNKKRDESLKKILGEERSTKYTKEMEKRRAERGGQRRR